MLKILNWILTTGFALAMLSQPINTVHAATTKAISTKTEALQKRIEEYKKFKRKCEDKDFQLKIYHVKRIDYDGKTKHFDHYHIAYGIIKDDAVYEYRKSTLYVQTPKGWRVKKDDKPLTRLETLENLPYPIALVFKTLQKEDLEKIIGIYEFNDGAIDIRIASDKENEKKFVERLCQKLQEVDEKNDKKKPETEMEPVLPAKSQRMIAPPLFIDQDGNEEPDHVLIFYCMDGSYFDKDPHNNRPQVALKYRLVTKQDLHNKSKEEGKELEKRLGSWLWDKPSEVLIDFDETKGPDIIFYDIGKVADGKIIDEKPDGVFDKHAFIKTSDSSGKYFKILGKSI